ncbi:hypothetical protein ACQEU5_08825 [Marinactinospora thermotolerans]|uniref:Uncharacterized protein n=1 Tax=Marinactinospora thermotolerans DSM 45154 TaxID=1122192 RepID=A0A1T4T390_9ACTN|nr:hypothetical protein [Marinactinospora thermotolerans]SKA34867.1 hypothetical protein SAMN02745673_04409 [Marinactinospora thermotolerans DSM 45154]
MPITLKRRKGNFETEAALARLQEIARERAERLGPYADQARDTALLRINQARGWTAPRLETAAQRVEDTVAPRVAGLLSAAAHKVEPVAVRKRRFPRSLLIVGTGAVAAVLAYGVLRARQASQDAEWQENLNHARDQVRETKERLAAKAQETSAKLKGSAEEVAAETKKAKETAAQGSKESKDIAAQGAKESKQELNGRVTADKTK